MHPGVQTLNYRVLIRLLFVALYDDVFAVKQTGYPAKLLGDVHQKKLCIMCSSQEKQIISLAGD